jgi:tRNA pseudouridine55 synthase
MVRFPAGPLKRHNAKDAHAMDGILLLDKPQGMTSHDAVFRVRKMLHEPRVGHAGTLDPLASGLLVLALGRATKLLRYFAAHDKVYQGEIVVGIATDTDDTDGRVIASAPCPYLDGAVVDAALVRFVGPSLQVPPAYAAIKVDGRKLYEYARKGLPPPDVAPRPIEVYRFERTSAIAYAADVARFAFAVHVSKGTYVRALCRDLGTALGFPATLAALRRQTVGAFSLGGAATLSDLEHGRFTLLDPLAALAFPRVSLDAADAFRAQNGARLPEKLFSGRFDAVVTDAAGAPIAIYEHDDETHERRLAVML